jgi:hypothetical protein
MWLNERFPCLVQHQAILWSQHQVSPPWCSGPSYMVWRWLFWCAGVGGVAPHWSYVLPLLTDLATWGRCADSALSLDICQECCTRQGSSPPGHPSHADRNSGIILGSRLTDLTVCLASILFIWLKAVCTQGRNVKEVESSRGWVKSLQPEV